MPRMNRMVCGGGGGGRRGGSLGGCVTVALGVCIAIRVLLMFALAFFSNIVDAMHTNNNKKINLFKQRFDFIFKNFFCQRS